MAEPWVEGPVVDRSGMAGLWDFQMEFLQGWRSRGPSATGGESDTYPLMEVALAGELGFRVEHGRVPVRVLVIDHMERPTPN